jgi:hypothetical protein
MPTLSVFNIRIKPSAVFFVKYIIEACDNLYQITTLDIETGLVEIKAAHGTENDLLDMLNATRKKTGFDCITKIN